MSIGGGESGVNTGQFEALTRGILGIVYVSFERHDWNEAGQIHEEPSWHDNRHRAQSGTLNPVVRRNYT